MVISPLHSQTPFSFERIDSSDGLSDNQAICIHQDQEGFLWIGTMSGLNRYDGTSIKSVTQEYSEDSDLFDQRIMSIDEDDFGNLWLDGFAGSIQMFNKVTHEIKNFPVEFGYYPPSSSNGQYLHKDGFAVLAFKDLGVFVVDTKKNGALIGKYLFDEETLSHNTYIKGVFAKDRNNIWVSTYSGPLQLNIDTQSSSYKFTHIVQPLNNTHNGTIAYQKNSSVYFAVFGKGLVIHNFEKNTTKIIDSVSGFDLKDIIHLSGHKDQLRISTSENNIMGVSLDGEALLFQENRFNNSPIGRVTNLFNDSDDNIWFRTLNHEGIFRYNPNNNKTSFFPFSFAKSELQSKNNVIRFFKEDKSGNIWFGTTQDGVLFYNKESGLTQNITNNPKDNNSLISNSLQSIYEDQRHNIWLGTQFGISKINLKKKDFRSIIHHSNLVNQFDNKTDALFKDSYGNTWCSTFSGELYVYDNQLQVKQIYSNLKKQHGYTNAVIFSFCEDSKGRLWIGSKGEGVFLLDLKKFSNNLDDARFTHFLPEESSSEVYDIIEDSKQRIWLASYGKGLLLLIEKNSQFNFLDYNQFLDPFCPFSITQGRCLLEDKEGRLWFGGLNGLINFKVDEQEKLPISVNYFYYKKENKVKTITYNDIKSLYEDQYGMIWIGTYGGGLNSYDPATKNFNHYNVSDGLANNIVYATINDNQGNLWISTKNGLSKFNLNKKKFINYSTYDGLLSNEFTEAKPFHSDNKLFFGTIKGVSYLNSSDLDSLISYPDILLTDLYIFNKLVNVTNLGPLTKDINVCKTLKLDHTQNSFRLNYSTTDYNSSIKKSIEYKLENFDAQWFQSNKSPNITYTNIPPGEYILKIRFADVLDDISSPQKELSIIITPPFWKTNWAFLIYIALSISIFYIIINVITKIKVLRNNLKIEQEITDFKLRFFTNVSHELRTPLTLIINPVKEVITGNNNLSSTVQSHLKLAYNNANNLLKLINEILDFRKIQTNNAHLKVSEIEVESFFNKITSDFNFVAKTKDIVFETSSNVTEQLYWFDPEKLEKVIINLLTNAFKFTSPKGKVIINLNSAPSFFTIIVEDTGLGMNKEQRERVFQRYYKSDNINGSFFAQGAGIGLCIVEEFVKLHNGSIEVESQPNKGTKFTLTIHGQKERYRKEEIAEQNTWTVGSESRIISSQMENNTIEQKKVGDAEAEHTILLVEDNKELLSMLHQKLCQYFKVYTATNGQEGLNALKKHKPDLIVTDLMMPIMDGIEMTRELKINFDTCHIPVIMLTAKSSNEDKVEGYGIGADSYVLKPFDFEVLIARIGNLLKQRETLKQKFNNDVEFDSRSVAIEKQDQEFLEAAITYVIDHMGDENFNLQDMYATLGFSKTVFYNKIKALTEQSPNHFVRTLKLKEAGKLLKSTNLSISEAAFKVGYSDVNYFRDLFKKQFKMTPSEYMKG